jgi:YfiH family protein
MFKRKERYGKFIGYSLERDGRHFFFGSRFLPKTSLAGTFPEYEFSFLKQVHGNTVVEADPTQTVEADAQFTSAPGRALISQTADCVPVLLSSRSRVCAIHSGWKGCAQNIVGRTKEVFAGETPTLAAIGPHIMQASFEVGRDVAHQLLKADPTGGNEYDFFGMHEDPGKVYFDLTELVRRQIRAAFGRQIEILECLEDTKTSVQFHSFRRDREKAERQYSFVVIKPEKPDGIGS